MGSLRFLHPPPPPRPTLGNGVAIKRGVQFHTTPLASKAHCSRGKTGPHPRSRPRPCMEMCLLKERPVSGFAPRRRALEIETEPGREGEQVMETLTDSKAQREAERSPERDRQTDSRWAREAAGGVGGSCCGDVAPTPPHGTESTAAGSPHGPAPPLSPPRPRRPHRQSLEAETRVSLPFLLGDIIRKQPGAHGFILRACPPPPAGPWLLGTAPATHQGGVLRMQTRWGIARTER